MHPLWQSPSWEHFQKALGHVTIRLTKPEPKALMVIQKLFFGMSYGYIPRGPVLEGPEDLGIFLHELTLLAKHQRLIFTRVDPEKALPQFRYTKTQESHSVQPETTLTLDLNLSQEELLAQMKRKGRYNIALAEKKGVEVIFAKNDKEKEVYCRKFFNILTETTERDAFSAHDERYYQTLLRTLRGSEIFIASYEDQALAGAICIYHEDRAIYYYGASSNHHRELMAPYLLQWQAILEGKKRGCSRYDFLGIAPEDALEDHPWKGITEFKKKFGGIVVNYPRPLDIIHRPFWYTIYKVLKVIQGFLKS